MPGLNGRLLFWLPAVSRVRQRLHPPPRRIVSREFYSPTSLYSESIPIRVARENKSLRLEMHPDRRSFDRASMALVANSRSSTVGQTVETWSRDRVARIRMGGGYEIRTENLKPQISCRDFLCDYACTRRHTSANTKTTFIASDI